MEHALFIHRLRVRSTARKEEEHMQGETERMTYTTQRKRKNTEGDINAENTSLRTEQ